MKKRALITILLVFTMTLSMALGVYAYFTNQATSSNNNITTGTISIGAPNTGDNAAIITASNLLPGGSATNNVSINNLGTSNFKYAVSAIKISGDDPLFAALIATITNGGTTVYSGSLSALNYALANSNLAAGGTDALVFTVSLPTTAGNILQGKSVDVQFMFSATQTDNPGWGE